MKHVGTNGYKSFINKNFTSIYKQKYKLIHFKQDIKNTKKFKKFIESNNLDYFIHFAGLSSLKCQIDKENCFKINYVATKNIIDQLNKINNKPFFIFISSCHVYKKSNYKLNESSKTKPESLYGELKLKAENYIKKNYKNYCILRVFNIYGENQPQSFFIPDISKKIKNNELIKINKSIRDFIHVKAVARVIDFVIKKRIVSTINVGSGNGHKLFSIVKKIANKYKIKPNLIVTNKFDKIVADIKLLRSLKFKFKSNEKNLNI